MALSNIASLLQESLFISGCTDLQIGSFDGHSPIELKLECLPTLNIGVLDNGVWFWSTLTEVGDMQLENRAAVLLRFLMQVCSFARTEQMQLVKKNDQLEVRVLLADTVIADASAFANALDRYVNALETLCGLLR